MFDTSDFRKGLKIEIDGSPWIIIDFQHVKPGKGTAFVRTRLKQLETGQTLDKTFRSGDKVGRPDLEEVSCTFMYQDGEGWHFMNTESYDTLTLSDDAIGDARNYLIEQLPVTILLFGGRAISIDLPNFIEAHITICDPAVAGNTATGATKPVTVETGYQLHVPMYISDSDVLKIDTRDGRFVERVNR